MPAEEARRSRVDARIHAVSRSVRRRLRRSAARRGVRVSVIIPVYNAVAYLPELLSSLDDQGLTERQLQVIIVDDGSTDGSAELLDAYAADHPRAIVLHQENSGWPGQPRNRGLALATGHWVFFADADDFLAPNALRTLADFGDQHDAQLVLPRAGRYGNRRSGRPFEQTMIDAPKRICFRTFTPHKLVRRRLIEDNGIRFPEGRVRLEDGIFFSRCYLLADRVSILADRDYYFLRGREDGMNLTAQRIEPAPYIASLERIAVTVYELSRGPKMQANLIAELVGRKCLRVYRPERFPRATPATQQAWLDLHAAFFTEHVTPEVKAALSETSARKIELVLAGDRDGMLALIAGQVDPDIEITELDAELEPELQPDLRPDVAAGAGEAVS